MVAGRAVERSVVLGLTVAVDTETHAEVFDLSDFLHGLNRAVTGLTIHTSAHVGRVVEVNVIWQHMNVNPLNGFPAVIGFA